jgi:ankyrin repeat protein
MSNQIGGVDKIIMVRLLSLVPNFTDYNNQSILHQIVWRGDKDLVSKIIKQMEKNNQLNEFINSKNTEGNTPLHIAVINGYDDIAHLLISKGADTQIEDANGKLVVFEEESNSKFEEIIKKQLVIHDSSNNVNDIINNLVKPENNYIELNLTPKNKKEYEKIIDQSPKEVDLDMLKNFSLIGGSKSKPKKSLFGKRFI